MKSRRFPIVLLSIFFTGLLLFALAAPLLSQSVNKAEKKKKKQSKKEICLTFNELPVAKAFDEVDRTAITYLILDALKRHNVKATGFVVGNNIEDSWDILGQWLNNGHKLGSMSQTNEDFNGLSIQKGIREIRTGDQTIDQMLSGFGQKKRYFRFPYLHYGRTVESREQTSMFLEAHGIIVAHATIVPDDFLYNLTLDKLGHEPDSSDFNRLMNEYVNHVLDELERVERLTSQIIGGRGRQILSLRANRLNAVFLEDLLGALEDSGYRFISLDRALKSKLFKQPEAYYGSRGIGFADMIAESDPDLLPAE